MEKSARRKFSGEFKTKVVLEVLKEQKTISFDYSLFQQVFELINLGSVF